MRSLASNITTLFPRITTIPILFCVFWGDCGWIIWREKSSKLMTKACMQTMGQIVDIPAWWTRWSRPEPNSWRDQSHRGCLQPEKNVLLTIVFSLRLLFSNSANLTPAIDPEVNPLVHELFELWGVCLRHLGMLDKELWNRTHLIIGIDSSS